MALDDRLTSRDSRLAAATQRILTAFQTGDLPEALAQRYIKGYDYPARTYSARNQLLLNLQGDPDARGYRAWSNVDRHVLKGQKARHILAPRLGGLKTEQDEATGEERTYRPILGWQYLPVFGYDQTAGAELRDREAAQSQIQEHLQNLPLRDVAEAWNLNLECTDRAHEEKALGWYQPQENITLGVENLSTWAHELVHAADDRAGNLECTTAESRASAEIVAELGGAVLLTTLGYHHQADLGGCWNYLRQYGATLPTIDKLLNRTIAAVDLILETAERQ